LEKSGCSAVVDTSEMIRQLARFGRLGTTIKLFEEMKTKGFCPNTLIFTTLVDRLSKAGRLDMTMKVYMDGQAVGF
jgi:pentatricopeptide repeat protein